MENPVGTALASFGMSGRVFHGPLLKAHSGFRVRKVLERTHNYSHLLFPEAVIVRNYRELLSDPAVELVVVNTPDRFHYAMVWEALEADKHVVVEKPFTHTAAEAEALIRLAAARRRLLTVFQNRRWDGDFLAVKQVIGSGKLGKLVEFESHFDRFRPEVAENSWKEADDEHTGVLYNLGSHMVDQALQLFGLPQAVTAHLRVCRPGGKATDYYDLRLHYEALSVLLRSSYLVLEEGPRYILHGTEGSFIKYGIDPQEELLKKGMLPEGPGWGEEPEEGWGLLHTMGERGETRERLATPAGDYPVFYRNLHAALRQEEPLAVEPGEAREVIRVLEAALESNRRQATVVL